MTPLPRASIALLSRHRVAVAVSGGADSVALALWLCTRANQPPHDVTVAGLIHVNHQLRGAESDRDEAFCRELAGRLGVAIDVVSAPVARPGSRSPEAAARAARYRAFESAAARLGATRVATAHTADDQAETVLLRLLRGASSRGVSGIRAERGLYVRPLLACRRQVLRDWLRAQGETCCEDSTNTDRTIARNQIRHDLLPVIERIAPGGVAALARAAALAEDDERVLQRLAIEKAATVVLTEDTRGADLDLEGMQTLEPALARRVLRNLLERLAPQASWNGGHFETIRRLAGRSHGGGALDLPGIRVERVSKFVRVRTGAPEAVPPFAYELPVPGEVTVPEAGMSIRASVREAGVSEDVDGSYLLVVPGDAALPLTVRNRRPGDRVALSGGTRKVQDLMVDAKIPRSERSRVPLVVGADGQVIGVILGPNARVAAVRPEGVGMVVLSIRKLERT